MTVGLEFGVDQRVVYLDLEPATVRRDQGQVPDIVFELFEQFIRQAHGPVGIMSYSAVDDLDVNHWVMLSKIWPRAEPSVEYRLCPEGVRSGVHLHRTAFGAVQVSRPGTVEGQVPNNGTSTAGLITIRPSAQ